MLVPGLEFRQFGVVLVGGKVSKSKDSSMLASVFQCLSWPGDVDCSFVTCSGCRPLEVIR